MKRFFSLAAPLLAALVCACDGDDTPAAQLPIDASTADAARPDAAGADGSVDATIDGARPDAGDASTPWPPTTPWWTETSCALPPCSDSDAPPAADTSGTWTVTLTTTATDCNASVQALDARLAVGNVHTDAPHPLDVVGSCDYSSAGGSRHVDGTIRGSTLVTCEAVQRVQGVLEIDQSSVFFAGAGIAAGTARSYFTNLPSALGQPGNKCHAEFSVAMKR